MGGQGGGEDVREEGGGDGDGEDVCEEGEEEMIQLECLACL